MRKYIKICIILLIVFTINLNTIKAQNILNKEFIKINVPSAIVIDSESGRILFEKNADEKRAMASLTKVMTSIILVETCDINEMIEVPGEATWIGGSEVGLKKGDMVSAKSLLYGMLLPSRE